VRERISEGGNAYLPGRFITAVAGPAPAMVLICPRHAASLTDPREREPTGQRILLPRPMYHQSERTKMSILNHPAISGNYLFPQPRLVSDPFNVEVDGAQLACYRRVVDEDGYTAVHFHGNGEAVSDYVPDLADEFASIGLNSFFVEYREYGGSTGKAQLSTMLGDGEAAIAAAGLAPEKVIAFGRSIGSLYAIELAHRQPEIAGLIIESGIADPAERFLAYADLSAAGIDEADVLAEVELHFNHEKKLSAYRNPLLILHTECDGLIDIIHAERILEWAASPQKRLVRFSLGDHNSIMAWNRDEYFEAVREFVRLIEER